MTKIILWIKALRLSFFICPIMSAVIASSLAFNEDQFSWIYLIISIIIIAGINAGINLTNDYFDHISKDDEVNKYYNIFSGGSRVIQDKLISPRTIITGVIISFTTVSVLGLYVVFRVNFNLIWFGLAGIVLGYFYTAPPFKIVYRGWGEFIVFLLAGPVAVVGSYFLITGDITLKSVLLSFPQGLLIMLILFVNEFPDYTADIKVNKRHLVVRLGRKRSSYLYLIFIVLAYLSVLIPVTIGIFPSILLIILITLPLAGISVWVVLREYKDEKKMFPAQANTILIAIICGILLSAGFVFDKIFIR